MVAAGYSGGPAAGAGMVAGLQTYPGAGAAGLPALRAGRVGRAGLWVALSAGSARLAAGLAGCGPRHTGPSAAAADAASWPAAAVSRRAGAQPGGPPAVGQRPGAAAFILLRPVSPGTDPALLEDRPGLQRADLAGLFRLAAVGRDGPAQRAGLHPAGPVRAGGRISTCPGDSVAAKTARRPAPATRSPAARRTAAAGGTWGPCNRLECR